MWSVATVSGIFFWSVVHSWNLKIRTSDDGWCCEWGSVPYLTRMRAAFEPHSHFDGSCIIPTTQIWKAFVKHDKHWSCRLCLDTSFNNWYVGSHRDWHMHKKLCGIDKPEWTINKLLSIFGKEESAGHLSFVHVVTIFLDFTWGIPRAKIWPVWSRLNDPGCNLGIFKNIIDFSAQQFCNWTNHLLKDFNNLIANWLNYLGCNPRIQATCLLGNIVTE